MGTESTITCEEMRKVSIIGLRSVMPAAIDSLYSLKLLHIHNHTKSSEMDLGDPLPHHEDVAKLLVDIRTLASHLDLGTLSEAGTRFIGTIEEMRSRLDELLPAVVGIVKQRQYYRKIGEAFTKGRQGIAAGKLPLDYDGVTDYESMSCFLGFVSGDPLPALTGRFESTRGFAADFEGQTVVALYVGQKDENAAGALLEEFGFVQFDTGALRSALPALRGTVANSPSETSEILPLVERKLEKLDHSLKELGSEHRQFLSEGYSWLVEETRKAEAPLRFGMTDKAFFVNGWVTSRGEKHLKSRLGTVADAKIVVRTEPVPHGEGAPVKQNLPGPVRPFKHFLDIFSTPAYGEVNPLFFMFLTFPLFFGFMLGDLGYGIVVLGLALLLGKLARGKPLFGLIPPASLKFSALATMFFGLVFGEFFGAELGLYKPFFHRIELEFIGAGSHAILHVIDGTSTVLGMVNAEALLSISVVIGMVHLSLGLLIGFSNVWRMHSLRHAVTEKLGWLLLMPGFLWLFVTFGIFREGYAAAARAVLPPDIAVMALTGAAVVLLLLGEGIIGLVEIPGLLSNIFSYARLMAVGLASVLLAVVANQLAAPSFAGGPVGWLLGAFILLVFHLLNIFVGIMGSFLHSLRLHYVEHFSKFYIGGGREYVPFGVEE